VTAARRERCRREAEADFAGRGDDALRLQDLGQDEAGREDVLVGNLVVAVQERLQARDCVLRGQLADGENACAEKGAVGLGRAAHEEAGVESGELLGDGELGVMRAKRFCEGIEILHPRVPLRG
jgi:hypothetical protein